MKTFTTLTLAALLIIGFAANTYAQVTASASATATIITPIAIAKSIDMNFGNVAVSTASGTVVLAPEAAVPAGRSNTGGVTLPNVVGTVTAAKFIVTGSGTSTYAITLPSTPLTLTGSVSGTMTVTAFTSFPSGTGALVGGTQDLYVGGTLNVDGSEAAGTYTSATPFDVTVNYN